MKRLKSYRITVLVISLALLIGGVIGISTAAEESTPSLDIFSKNLAYGGTISIAFAVDAQNVDAEAVELLVYLDEPAEGDEEDYRITESYADTVYGCESLVFLTPGIAAKDMTKEIYVKAHAVVGGTDVYSEPERYSIAEYAYDMQYRSKINDNFIKLGAALLEVGEQIQTLLPYNEDNSPADFFYVAAEDGTVDGSYSAGLFKRGETYTLSYSGDIPEGKIAVWKSEDSVILNGSTVRAAAHEVYTISFEDELVSGAYFNDVSKDGTRYDYPMTAAGTYALLGIGNNALGTYEAGTTYIVETDFTYNGGTYVNGSPAFFGLQATSTLDNKNMFFGTYISYSDESAGAVSILGAEFTKGITYNIRFEYTVGAGDYTVGSTSAASASQAEYIKSCLRFFVNGKEIAIQDDADLMIGENLRNAANADRSFWGLGLKVRSASYAGSDFSVTFDNTYIAPKATVTPDIDSYYERSDVEGARLDFSEADDINGIVTDASHSSNKGYGTATVANGVLNVAGNPAWYGLLFKNPDFDAAKTYANGTKYVFEADITYNGGASKSTSDTGASFIGFITRDYGSDIRNGDMAYHTYAKYESGDAVLDLFGADFAKGVTHKLTVVYTVGTTQSVEVYLDLVRLGTYTLSATSGVADTNCAGFAFYFRGTGYTDNLDLTFDNVFVGAIEAE